MAREIKFSYRNKAFITKLVTALEERDLPVLAATFAQHSDPEVYTQTKESRKPTDYALLCELQKNIGTFSADDVTALILAVPSRTHLSPMTKLALYMVSYPHITAEERQDLFDEPGPLLIVPQQLADLKAKNEGLSDHVLRDEKDLFRCFYRDSVVANQAPDEFSTKFKLTDAVGLPCFVEINALAYEDTPDGASAFSQYQEIFDSVSEDHAKTFIWNARAPMICYDMLKTYGAKAFSESRNRYFSNEFSVNAFTRDDHEYFKELIKEAYQDSTPRQLKELASKMLDSLGGAEPSASQLEMISSLDQNIRSAILDTASERIQRQQRQDPFDPILHCIATGHEMMLDRLLESVGEKEIAPHLVALMPEIERLLPRMSLGGMISDAQKRMVLRLHALASESAQNTTNMLRAIEPSQAYRIKNDGVQDTAIPLSELTIDERRKWADSDIAPPPERNRGRMMRWHTFSPF
ncbi:hypothetical protein [Pseudomonas amygdali]|uniref:Uncharacterized protein n=2 Tax=Pseudomonas amygdali pv. lachrymans TaxID=53707 RepID=A0ABR5KRW7_PSEAV|nr:hypothetical protein [Pseudomonas amygdali]AXH59901.1 hypothetical protein PLA107_032260 [Pseudomonas amygdali pv. lachrymans str. M301315]KPC17310.1 Uncharacterized protein AC499_0512 [Pseudomonas amygdali pv. lachrymans]RMT06569.1 hypothetical protein ALP54_03772 [Pseudomonas amygdali pv. lachrymans]